jgi:hypothetical protein
MSILVPAGLVLFAQIFPTPLWTTKEVLIAIGSVVGTMLTVGVPVAMYLHRRASKNARKRAKKAEGENQQLREEITRLRQDLQDLTQGAATGQQKLGEVSAQMQTAQQEVEKLLASKARTEEEAAGKRQLAEQLKTDLSAIQKSLAEHQAELAAERRRIVRAIQKDGRTWGGKGTLQRPEIPAPSAR